MQIKQLLISILSLLLLQISALASNLKESVSFGVDSYSDNADVQVYSPTLSMFKKVSQNWMFGLKMRIDAITAASIKNGSSPVNIDAVTSASIKSGPFNELRYAPTLMAMYDDGDNSFSFGAYYSSERDYVANAIFANYVRQLNEQNTALGFGISQSFDKWTPVFKRNLEQDNRNETKIDFSINQLFTPKFSMQAIYSYMYSEGFLSSPYHYILQNNISRFEKYPNKRYGNAYALKGVYLLNDSNAVNFSYRYYFDDWGISSNTINTELLHDFTSKFTSGLRFRYYSQSASSFVKPIGSYANTSNYFVIDYRMSEFNSYTVGIPFIYKKKNGDKITASIDFYQTSSNQYIKSWYGINKINAVFTTLTYKFNY